MDEPRERQRHRLLIMEALVEAQERRAEVVAAVSAAENDAEALDAVVALLGLRERQQAVAVLDLQMRRMTREGRERLRQERDELTKNLNNDR